MAGTFQQSNMILIYIYLIGNLLKKGQLNVQEKPAVTVLAYLVSIYE